MDPSAQLHKTLATVFRATKGRASTASRAASVTAPSVPSAASRTSLIALSAADVLGWGVAMQLAATTSMETEAELDCGTVRMPVRC